MAKQTPQQYLSQHKQILFDHSSPPNEPQDYSSEFNENGKRRSPDRSVCLDVRWSNIPNLRIAGFQRVTSLLLMYLNRAFVGLNSVRCEILSPITIVSYDKVRGRNKTHWWSWNIVLLDFPMKDITGRTLFHGTLFWLTL